MTEPNPGIPSLPATNPTAPSAPLTRTGPMILVRLLKDQREHKIGELIHLTPAEVAALKNGTDYEPLGTKVI